MSPVFASAIRDYTSSVDYSVSKVALIPTLQNGATATISVNNQTPVDFSCRQSVDLKVGKNTIKIVVSANDLESTTYTVIITRSRQEYTSTASNAQDNSTKKSDTDYVNTSKSITSPNTGSDSLGIILPIVVALLSLGIMTITHIISIRKKRFYE